MDCRSLMITIVGANGYLGKNLLNFFLNHGYKVYGFNKHDSICPRTHYGTVIYCAGVSINFNQRVFETLEAHVLLLKKWLEAPKFEKFIYISSSRLYNQLEIGIENIETLFMPVNDIYNQTKLIAENLCLNSQKQAIILRLSNVISYNPLSKYFLWNFFQHIKYKKKIIIEESNNSSRDYLPVTDFLNIIRLIEKNKEINGLFNLSSSINITHQNLLSLMNIKENEFVQFGDKENESPLISNNKISTFFNYIFQDPKPFISQLWQQYLGDQ